MERANLSKKANAAAKRFRQTLLALLTLLFSTTSCFASTIGLQWDAVTAEDLAGYKVYYSDSAAGAFTGTGANEGASPIAVAKTNQAVITGLDPSRPYYFAVTAYDTAGVESAYSDLVVVPELLPPSVNITSPAAGSQVTGTVSISASASDNVGVASVRFYVDGTLAYTSNEAPHLFSWQTSSLQSGSYTISAEALDAAENVGKSGDLTLHLVNDAEAPAISLLAPGNGATLSGSVAITAGATDNIGVAKIELYENGTLVFAGNDNPVSYNWNTAAAANGSYVLSAKAFDAAGNESLPASVTVKVLNDKSAPVVSIVSPVNGSMARGTVTVALTASDDVAVTRVEFYVNGELRGTSTSAPYSFSWNSAALANGFYPLSAKAYDAAGNAGHSAAVTLYVSNDLSAPTVNAFALPAISNSLKVPVLNFSCSDNVGVAGYLLTESATPPAASDPRWSATAPTTFSFAGAGSHALYAWARDAAGHVSAGRSASVLIDTVPPVISSLSLANGTSSVTIKASGSDNVAVAKIELYVDNLLQMQSPATSLIFVWNAGLKKAQTITIKVHDTAGNVRSQSFKVAKV